MMCLTNYASVRKMWEDALYAQDVYWTHGAFGEAIRYCRIANYLFDKMMKFEKENILL